jgi:hypothetical protein
MTDTDSTPSSPAALWKYMTAEQRRAGAEAFWQDRESAMEQAEVVATIAKRINFRYKSVQAMSLDRKVKQLLALQVSDAVAGRLLVTYHLASQRPMMGRFLDLVGIDHDNGLIAEEAAPKPDGSKLADAARTLKAEFPSQDVELYFSTLVLQDPDAWAALKGEISKTNEAPKPLG